MRKKLTAILAAFFALLILCGSTLPDGWYREDGSDVILRFADMPYERPDAGQFRAMADSVTRALKDGAGYRKTVALLEALFTRYYSANTMFTIADIHSYRDLTDEFWADEYDACLSALTEIEDIMEDVYLACGASPYGERLARDFFGEGFLEEYGEDAEEMLSDGYVGLLEQENALLSEYRDLIADPTVMVRGREVPLSDALYDVWSDRDYDALLNAYYEKYNPLLGELYIRLMDVRKAQAKELGYGSYAEMMYDIGFDRDFSIEQGRAFIESIKKWVLPVYTRRMDEERQAELMEGYVPEEMLLGVLETVSHGLGGEIAQAYDFMRRNELCDLSMSDVKAEISFQTYLDDYDAPYLFVYPYGDREDIITVTHEFGHYAEAYISCGWYRSMDLAEVYSQAMQFLSIKPLEGVLGARDTAVLRLLNLYDALDTLVWQTVYAEFEERAFQTEDPTVEKLNALMEEISLEYGLTKEEAEGFAPQWVDVTHFFEQPFYVISYPVSACCALEIYEKELTDGSGIDTYLHLAGSEAIGLLEATEEVGLHNPLSDARVQEVASLLDRLLGS